MSVQQLREVHRRHHPAERAEGGQP